MLKEKEIQGIVLHTLNELRQTVEASSKETYTRDELIMLLDRVSDFMTKGGTGE